LPELPDVEVFRRYLDRTSLHRSIRFVEVNDAGTLGNVSAGEVRKRLVGHRFEETRRRGKHLLARLDNGRWVTFHFGMTGYLKYFKSETKAGKHDRVVLDFANGYHLAYVCQRKLGRVGLVREPDRFFAALALGPDALSLDRGAFEDLMGGRRGSIKPALMDQALLAGIGNIYSDEILFHARVHPKAAVSDLAHKDVGGIFKEMKHVLLTAIERKADLDRLPRTWLVHRRREGAACPRCGGEVARIRLSGRSAYFCPACQSGWGGDA
jgi:formamidopyrimidine-DNA glycosylase